jgi:hypothetical protein
MTVSAIHAYLVHAGKSNPAAPAISGNELTLSGKLFDMLSGIFVAGAGPHDFEVTFKHTPDGQQMNECRDLVLGYASNPTLAEGMKIADRLRQATDNRSGIGLLFLMYGQHGVKKRMLISRFPADQAILAEVSKNGLDVEFLEQVFIRRMSAYKALMLEHVTPVNGFWSGIATDRQAGGSAENISNYWIEDFLSADFSETPAAGTKRLAVALKMAVRANPDLHVKAQIAHAVSLAPNVFQNQQVSVESFCKHFGFSDMTIATIVNQLSKPSLATKNFKFDATEFLSKVPYRTDELENGALLTAKSEDFEKVFEKTDKGGGVFEYSTQGRISNQRVASR